MSKEEKELLAEAAIPLEALYCQIKIAPYTELTGDMQEELCKSVLSIRKLIFGKDLTEEENAVWYGSYGSEDRQSFSFPTSLLSETSETVADILKKERDTAKEKEKQEKETQHREQKFREYLALKKEFEPTIKEIQEFGLG